MKREGLHLKYQILRWKYRKIYRDVRAERAYFIKAGKFQPLTHTDEHRHFF